MNILLRKISNYKIAGVRFLGGLLLTCFLVQPVLAENSIWFSNKPPSDDKRSAPNGMHGLSAVRGKRGMMFIKQWLRDGYNPHTSKYISLTDTNNFEFYIYSPKGKGDVGEFNNNCLSYASKEEGYYNGYMVLKYVSNDTLYVDIAKAEMLNHSCRNGHVNERKKIGPDIYPKTIPAEIIRKRNSTEDFHYFASSGDKIDYQFIIDGKPVEGATLAFNTQKGWQKVLFTNEDGISTFQIIQDYFSSWQELNSRKIYYYVIFGKATITQNGIYDGHNYSFIKYTTSLSDGYRPAKTMYMSMFWAFVIFTLTVILTIGGIFIYKIKRNKVYKEVRFDEKN